MRMSLIIGVALSLPVPAAAVADQESTRAASPAEQESDDALEARRARVATVSTWLTVAGVGLTVADLKTDHGGVSWAAAAAWAGVVTTAFWELNSLNGQMRSSTLNTRWGSVQRREASAVEPAFSTAFAGEAGRPGDAEFRPRKPRGSGRLEGNAPDRASFAGERRRSTGRGGLAPRGLPMTPYLTLRGRTLVQRDGRWTTEPPFCP